MMVFNEAAAGRSHHQMPATSAMAMEGHMPAPSPYNLRARKRKAEHDANNERLSKRMSLLNLEQGGSKLYVPVEHPQPHHPSPQQLPPLHTTAPAAAAAAPSNHAVPVSAPALAPIPDEEPMQLDDTKHKVYIYNLDDELTSDDDSDDTGRLVFLPDIEKHLRTHRLPVPRPIVPNQDGELAGMQLVLYSDGPSSLSVPAEQDSVRKAILEARARVRERQAGTTSSGLSSSSSSAAARAPTKVSFATPVKVPLRTEDAPMVVEEEVAGPSGVSAAWAGVGGQEDPDAMDLD